MCARVCARLRVANATLFSPFGLDVALARLALRLHQYAMSCLVPVPSAIIGAGVGQRNVTMLAHARGT